MTDVEDETKGLEMGAIDYIFKPVSPPILKARVKNHLELKRYRDILEKQSHEDVLIMVHPHFYDYIRIADE